MLYALTLQLDGAFNADCCIAMFRNICNPHVNRSMWTEQEDRQLLITVKKRGTKNWQTVANELGVYF